MTLVTTKKVLDCGWTNDVPEPLEKELRALWCDYELGNDFVWFPWSPDLAENYPTIANAVGNEEDVLIHYSW